MGEIGEKISKINKQKKKKKVTSHNTLLSIRKYVAHLSSWPQSHPKSTVATSPLIIISS